MRRLLSPVLAAALAIGAAACGSDDKESTATGSSAPDTTVESTVSDTVGDTTPASDPTTTVAPAVPVYPLTGLPVTDAAIAERPALVVKIDNNKAARPQSGLNEADIVFEEIVEVQTRFAAVFHSTTADPVGPIRSGRTQDIHLLGSFNRPLFLWSGGNKNVTRDIENSDFVNLSAQRSDVYRGAGFFRSDRPSPHDLYASATAAWTLAPEGAGPPPQQFRYRADTADAVGETVAGVDLEMDGLPIEWRWDGASGTYLRSNGGTPHNDALTGNQVSTHNLIIMVVDYRPSPADANSPEAQTIGSGDVLVYTAGVLVRGTWTRADRLAAITLTDADGNPIELTPGRTFVELARPGTFTDV